MSNKIISFDKLALVLPTLKGKRVLIGGCFDLLHIGHIRFLKKSKRLADKLIVALESDKFIKKKKKRQPFHNQQERAEIIAELPFVDVVILLPFLKSDADYFRLVKMIKPHIIAVSDNDPQIENKKKQAASTNGKVVVVMPLIENKATSKILNNLTS